MYISSGCICMYVFMYFQNHDPNKKMCMENTYIRIMMIIVKHKQWQQRAKYSKNIVRNKTGITLDQARSRQTRLDHNMVSLDYIRPSDLSMISLEITQQIILDQPKDHIDKSVGRNTMNIIEMQDNKLLNR